MNTQARNSATALVSISASVVAKDGLLNQGAFASLQAKVDKAVKAHKYKPVKEKKAKAVTTLTYHLYGQTVKAGRVIAKAVSQISGVTSAVPTASKAKTGPLILTIAIDNMTKGNAQGAVESLLSENVSPMPTSYYVVSARSKVVDFNAAKQKAQDPTYLSRRAVKVAERSKLSAAVRPLLAIYPKGVLPDALEKEVTQAVGSIKAHLKALEGQKKVVEGIRAGNKAEREATLSAAAQYFTSTLGEASVVKAAGMMGGSTVIVNLNGTYVSLTPSSKAAFAKAKRG
jgi:hypothetical protein